MSTQLQLRRGTTTQHSTFTGAAGEVTVDSTKNTVVVHNGSTAGGFPLVKEASIGVTVQAYDANTAKTNAAQTFTISQRGTVTTDNDGSFDMGVTNNFKCTPTGTFALTFTNITAGQSGFVLLVNTGGHAITAAATTKLGAATLSTISAAGTYLLSYFSDGTNVYVTASGAMA